MTKENLLKYLRDPEYLHQISYQELKTLVAEHPNSSSLRFLLAIKSKQENNDDFQRQLEFLSLYSIDRSHLFDVFTKEELMNSLPSEILLQEDYLELKELSALEKELNVIGVSTLTAGVAAKELELTNSNSISTPPIATTLDIEETSEDFYILDFEEDLEETIDQEAVPTDRVKNNLAEIEALFEEFDTDDPSVEANGNGASEADIIKNTIPLIVTNGQTNEDEAEELGIQKAIDELKSSPIPKTSFSTWYRSPTEDFAGFDLIGFNSKGIIDELAKTKKTTKSIAPKKTDEAEDIQKVVVKAEESLIFEEDIASETLAKLLILQGHYSKAIAMYEHLSLIFPEKSSLFAAEIQKIENLEDEIA